jgi:hypothetical protein
VLCCAALRCTVQCCDVMCCVLRCVLCCVLCCVVLCGLMALHHLGCNSGLVPRLIELLHDPRFVEERKWVVFTLINLLDGYKDSCAVGSAAFPADQLISTGSLSAGTSSLFQCFLN